MKTGIPEGTATVNSGDSLLDCLSPNGLQFFSRMQACSILGFLLLSAVAYVLLKVQSTEVSGTFFDSNICKSIFGHFKFDYDYFAVSTNAESAERVWLTELVILTLAILSSFFLLLVIMVLNVRGEFPRSRVENIRLVSAGHSSSLILMIVFGWVLYSGFSRIAILGNSRFSFGPNDMAIGFFISELMGFVGPLFGVTSFISILVFKVFAFFHNLGVKNAE